MYAANISFKSLPNIGFAMSHGSAHYKNTYGKNEKMSIEIAYITSGCVKLCFEEKEMYAEKGSVIVLFRHIPVHIETVGEGLHTHFTVLGEFDTYEFELEKKEGSTPKNSFLTIPFVTPPSNENEKISKEICKISSAMTQGREENALASSIAFLSILSQLSEMYKKNNLKSRAGEKLSCLIREYVRDNIEKNITVEDIEKYTGKSRSRISHAFRDFGGMTLMEYVNGEKMKRAAFLMRNENLPFRDALECVGIADESYGYRLFKRFVGVTPGQYMSVKHVTRDK